MTKTKLIKKVTKPKKKVPTTPKGYHSITPYLIVKQGVKAIAFYKKAFGAKEEMRMNKPGGKIGHAELKIGDSKFMLADECPEMGALAPKARKGACISIHLYVKDVDATVKKAVAAGAKLVRPIEDMFYGDRSGTVIDPYGHQWFVSTHIENVTPAMLKKRMAQMAGKK